MVHRFVPLVRVTVDVDDLKNIASLALIQAAHGFDPVAGMSFESYARMRIRGAILDEIRKSQPLSRTVYSRRKELETTMETLRMELNRQPEEEEIADRLGITVNDTVPSWMNCGRWCLCLCTKCWMAMMNFLIPTIITRRTSLKRTRAKARGAASCTRSFANAFSN